MIERISDYFHFSERNTSFKTEIIAGITTFITMAYILMVNSGVFSELGVVSYGAIYVATAISAVIGSVLIGLLANLPLAQASGMGPNAFFVYTVCFELGFSYSNALLFVLVDGILFVILTITGLRRLIFEAVPHAVKVAIPAGVGLFITFIGLQKSGLIVNNESTLVGLASFNLLGTSSWQSVMPLFITLITVILIAVLSKRNITGAILISMLCGAILYYVLGSTIPGFYDTAFSDISLDPFKSFNDFGTQAFGKVFTDGFDFSHYLSVEGRSVGTLIITFATTSLAFCMVDIFDTLGSMYGACRGGGIMVKNEKGEEVVPNMNQAMLADALATCAGAVCGTSTVTTFVESSAGIAVGGKTGFTSIVAAFLFLISLFLSPVAALIPVYAYSAALIYIGILMMSSIKDIDWKDHEFAFPAFLTIVIMPFSYNISNGIAFGLIVYIIIKALGGRFREIKISTAVLGVLFTAMLLMTH